MQIKHLEECSTTAGAVATFAQPFETVQKRTPEKKLKGSNLLKGIKTSAKYANSLHEGEGFPHDVDHMPGQTIKHQNTNCTACHGRKVQYKLGGKLYPDNKKGATKVICPTCNGTGDKEHTDTEDGRNYANAFGTYQYESVEEGAKVDRMVGHVKSSEKKLGKSSKEAENIAWATANKRGMLDNKNKKVAEGFSNDMSTEDMIAYLRQHHDENLHPDYLNHLTNTNSKFVLKNIPLNSIRTELSGLDRTKVEQYKKMDFSKAPPIVVGSDGNILDGYHRANVAKALGISTIKAYVGIKGQQGVAEADDKKEWQKQNAKPKQLGKTEKYFSTRHTTKDTGAADKEQGVAEGSISDLLNKDPTSPKFNDHSAPRKTKHSGSTPTPYEQGRLDAHRKKSYNNIHNSEQDAEDYKTGYRHVKSRQGVAEANTLPAGQAVAAQPQAGKKSGPINMVGPDKNKHVDVSANPSVAQSNDPELRRKSEWAQRHYGATLSPDEAMNKWMQRGLDITEKNDKRHDAEIAKLMKEIAGLKRIINNLHPAATGASNVAEGEITEDDVVLSADRRRPKSGLLSKPEQAMNPADVVKLDVPLLIRLLEFAKEDAADDMALHDLAEKLVAGCQRGRTLTMKDYDSLVPSTPEAPGPDEQEDFEGKFNQEMDEISDPAVKSYLGKAMTDTLTGKKDRNSGMKRAISRLAGTNKPLTK